MTERAKMSIPIEEQLRQYANAYELLQDASNAHAEIERTVENFDDIVESRIQLDGKRHAARFARKGVVSRHEPAAPDVVLGRGSYLATKFTITAALVGLVLLFGSIIGAILYTKAATRPDLSMSFGDEILLTTEPPCTMTMPVAVTNSSDTSYTVRLITLRSNEQLITLLVPNAEVAPLTTETFSVTFGVESLGGCPTRETVEPKQIRVDYRVTNNSSGAPIHSIEETFNPS